MNQNRIFMFIFIILWIFVLRFYFLEETRTTLHFLLGCALLGVVLLRYRMLKTNHKTAQANLTMLIAAILFITLAIWYIQPAIVYLFLS